MFSQSAYVARPLFKHCFSAFALLSITLLSAADAFAQHDWIRQVGPYGSVAHRVLAIKKTADDGAVVVTSSTSKFVVTKYSPSYDQVWRTILDVRPTADGAALEVDGGGHVYLGVVGEATQFNGVAAFKIHGESGHVIWRNTEGGVDSFGNPLQFHSQLAQGNFWTLNNVYDQATGVLEANTVKTETHSELVGDGTHYWASALNGPGRFVITKRVPNGGIVWTQFIETGGNHRHGLQMVERGGFLYAVGNVGDVNGSIRLALAKLDASDGDIVWQKYHDRSGRDWVNDLAVDTTGALVFTGYVNLAGAHQLMTWKYSTDGDLVWDRSIPGGSKGANNKLVLNENNDVFVAGFTTVNGSQNGSLAKYSAAGNQVWSRSVGLSGADELTHLYLSEGHPVAGGYVQDGNATRSGFFGRFRTSDGGTMDSEISDLLVGRTLDLKTVVSEDEYIYVSDDNHITKLDYAGNTRWARSPVIGLADGVSDLVMAQDLNPVYVDTAQGLVVTKLSKVHGGLIWQRKIGQFDVSSNAQIVPGKFGDFYVTQFAYNDDVPESERGSYVYRLNSNGDVIWTQHLVGVVPNVVVDADGALVMLYGQGANRVLKRVNLTSGSQLWIRPTQATRILVGGDGLPVIGGQDFTEKVRLNNGGFYWKSASGLPLLVDEQGNAYTAKSVGGGQEIKKIRGNDGFGLWTSSVPDMEIIVAADAYVRGGSFKLAIAGYNTHYFALSEDGVSTTNVVFLNSHTGQLNGGKTFPIAGFDLPSFISLKRDKLVVAGYGSFGMLGSTGFVAR